MASGSVPAERIAQLLARHGLLVQVRIHRNRSIALGLRGSPGAWRLGIHADLVDHAGLLADLPAWVRSRGRLHPDGIRSALEALSSRMAECAPPVPAEPLGGPIDLDVWLDRVHATWFATLPRPSIAWSRDSHRPRQRHIRFGSYWRQSKTILLHPRLDQTWIANIFVEHVIFHELCHHRQACEPLRGERPHSQRFQVWERAYPHHDLAIAWERANRMRLLRHGI